MAQTLQTKIITELELKFPAFTGKIKSVTIIPEQGSKTEYVVQLEFVDQQTTEKFANITSYSVMKQQGQNSLQSDGNWDKNGIVHVGSSERLPIFEKNYGIQKSIFDSLVASSNHSSIQLQIIALLEGRFPTFKGKIKGITSQSDKNAKPGEYVVHIDFGGDATQAEEFSKLTSKKQNINSVTSDENFDKNTNSVYLGIERFPVFCKRYGITQSYYDNLFKNTQGIQNTSTYSNDVVDSLETFFPYFKNSVNSVDKQRIKEQDVILINFANVQKAKEFVRFTTKTTNWDENGMVYIGSSVRLPTLQTNYGVQKAPFDQLYLLSQQNQNTFNLESQIKFSLEQQFSWTQGKIKSITAIPDKNAKKQGEYVVQIAFTDVKTAKMFSQLTVKIEDEVENVDKKGTVYLGENRHRIFKENYGIDLDPTKTQSPITSNISNNINLEQTSNFNLFSQQQQQQQQQQEQFNQNNFGGFSLLPQQQQQQQEKSNQQTHQQIGQVVEQQVNQNQEETPTIFIYPTLNFGNNNQ